MHSVRSTRTISEKLQICLDNTLQKDMKKIPTTLNPKDTGKSSQGAYTFKSQKK